MGYATKHNIAASQLRRTQKITLSTGKRRTAQKKITKYKSQQAKSARQLSQSSNRASNHETDMDTSDRRFEACWFVGKGPSFRVTNDVWGYHLKIMI